MMLACFELPIKLTNDNGGRTAHWGRTVKRKSEYVDELWMRYGKATAFDEKVKLRVVRILGPRERLWDADSIGRGSVKELIDAFVSSGWLRDDGPHNVESVEYGQEIAREKGPAVRVEFYTAATQSVTA